MGWDPVANIKGPAGDPPLPDPSSSPTGMVLGVVEGVPVWVPIGVITVDNLSEVPSGYIGLVAVRQAP